MLYIHILPNNISNASCTIDKKKQKLENKNDKQESVNFFCILD